MPIVKKSEPLPCDIYYQSEIWQPVPFNFDYEVSCYGNVRSLKRNKVLYLKLSTDTDGYKVINLYDNGSQKMHKVHRLLAIAFIPNPDNLAHVNHKDRIRNYNHIKNIEWTTERENTTHSFLTKKTSSEYTGVSLAKRKITKKWHAAITINGRINFLGYHDTEEDAARAYQNALNENNIINKYAKN